MVRIFLFAFDKSMDLVDKTKLLRWVSFYSLSKTHLARFRSFPKTLLILSFDINFNMRPVQGIQNKNLLHVFLFRECSFSGNRFYYIVKSVSSLGRNDDVSGNDHDVFDLICDQLFKGCWRMGGSPTFLKICHIYSKMLKFGTVIHCQKTSKKNIYHVALPLSSADIINFTRSHQL